ncbi:SLBB domain-containing protein [Candidatus Micrarchaeota archaeon]|nr:SLBB domain-containing protein [Candidatus Micrarchaeota archaeon]
MIVKIGVGSCGLGAGAEQAIKALEKSGAEVKKVGCIGLCYLEPLVEVETSSGPVFYAHVDSKEKAEKIAREIKAGNFKSASMTRKELEQSANWKKQVRRVNGNCGEIDPENIDDYIKAGGYEGLKKALKMAPEKVIAEVDRTGLRGRGGAGFPAAKKWQFCRAAKGETRYNVCNADEGNPGAFMNRMLMEGDPHKVLEGLIISSYAIGASKGYVFVRAEKALAAERMRKAVADSRKKGFLGDNILGSRFGFDVEVVKSAGAYVCGEETALIEAIEGKRGTPRARPPYPAQRGLYDSPTNINNVETLAHVTMILSKGADWFNGVGTQKSKGTKVFCLTGSVERPGAYEVPIGFNLKELVHGIGGLDGKPKLIESGGPAGLCLKENQLDVPLDFETMQDEGTVMGSGGVVVFGEECCPVDVAKHFMRFTRDESCGKCTPCREGTTRLYEMLEDLTSGKGNRETLEKISKLSELIRDTAFCGLGQGATNPLVSAMKNFARDFEAHADGKCPSYVCGMGK